MLDRFLCPEAQIAVQSVRYEHVGQSECRMYWGSIDWYFDSSFSSSLSFAGLLLHLFGIPPQVGFVIRIWPWLLTLSFHPHTSRFFRIRTPELMIASASGVEAFTAQYVPAEFRMPIKPGQKIMSICGGRRRYVAEDEKRHLFRGPACCRGIFERIHAQK